MLISTLACIAVLQISENRFIQNSEIFLIFSLQFAVELANLLQQPAPKEWQKVADHMKIPFDQKDNYHPEYDGYIKGNFHCFVVMPHTETNLWSALVL